VTKKKTWVLHHKWQYLPNSKKLYGPINYL